MKTSTVRGVKTCKIRTGSIVAAIRAISLRANRRHHFRISRYQCTCQHDVFGRRLQKHCTIACMRFSLSLSFSPYLSCKNIHRTLHASNVQPRRIATGRLHRAVVTVHRAGLPSPGIRNGTNDFFVGPIMRHDICRRVGRRCPDYPFCRMSGRRIGVPTK